MCLCLLSCCSLCVLLCSAAGLKIHPVITKFGTERRGLTAYVLTQEEMIKKHYPVKGESLSLSFFLPLSCHLSPSSPPHFLLLFVSFHSGMPGFEEFINTDSDDFVTDSSPLYGLDCEMVRCISSFCHV